MQTSIDLFDIRIALLLDEFELIVSLSLVLELLGDMLHSRCEVRSCQNVQDLRFCCGRTKDD